MLLESLQIIDIWSCNSYGFLKLHFKKRSILWRRCIQEQLKKRSAEESSTASTTVTSNPDAYDRTTSDTADMPSKRRKVRTKALTRVQLQALHSRVLGHVDSDKTQLKNLKTLEAYCNLNAELLGCLAVVNLSLGNISEAKSYAEKELNKMHEETRDLSAFYTQADFGEVTRLIDILNQVPGIGFKKADEKKNDSGSDSSQHDVRSTSPVASAAPVRNLHRARQDAMSSLMQDLASMQIDTTSKPGSGIGQIQIPLCQ